MRVHFYSLIEFLAHHRRVSMGIAAVVLMGIGIASFRDPERRSKHVAQAGISTAPRPDGSSSAPPLTLPSSDIPLYEPIAEEPSWALPAELNTEDVRKLVIKVESLSRDATRCEGRLKNYHTKIAEMTKGSIGEQLWDRLVHTGFHDAKLPLDWYEVVKDDMSVASYLARTAEEFAEGATFVGMALRIGAAKARLLGGHALLGDVLFVNACRAWLDARMSFLDRVEPLMVDVMRRLPLEFPTDE
jgi:hypothetical protein